MYSAPQLERCPECPSLKIQEESQRKYVVGGDWAGDDQYFHILFIAEGPGREENNRHKVFIGATGEELNETYLPLSGLSRVKVSLTNTFKCHWADSGDTPPWEVISSCAEFHLRKELAYHKPDMVVLMGGIANRLLGLDVDLEHGLLRNGTILGWTGPIYSTFHPALGMHMGGKMKALLDDFRRLRKILEHKYVQPKDRIKKVFTRITEPSDVADVLAPLIDSDIAVDTESVKKWRGYKSTITWQPYCATFCNKLGTGYMVKVENSAAMGEFLRWLLKYRRVIFHNFGYDERVLRAIAELIGVDFDLKLNRIEDTMHMAYHDARESKGLKSLSHRLLGSDMRSFDDVVIPHSRKKAIQYLVRAASMDWPDPRNTPTGLIVERVCPQCKGNGVVSIGRGKAKKTWRCDCKFGKVMVPAMSRKKSIGSKIEGFLRDYSLDPTKDPWSRWEGWEEDIEPLCKSILGAIPLPSIENAPEDEQIEYACGDAHQTLALFPVMQERLVSLRRWKE